MKIKKVHLQDNIKLDCCFKFSHGRLHHDLFLLGLTSSSDKKLWLFLLLTELTFKKSLLLSLMQETFQSIPFVKSFFCVTSQWQVKARLVKAFSISSATFQKRLLHKSFNQNAVTCCALQWFIYSVFAIFFRPLSKTCCFRNKMLMKSSRGELKLIASRRKNESSSRFNWKVV